ncbi:hypothetical protein AVEN_137177-1 [Araneus ventricosus]|uniref:Uncharacterized protein n=1 Tax=Araneus ventricosus TaxID=182803 RepID=A0A4Y2MUV6_ARAVE|nr:hypothetical protein AVEN_137177-1 [Araneus ventricosus]
MEAQTFAATGIESNSGQESTGIDKASDFESEDSKSDALSIGQRGKLKETFYYPRRPSLPKKGVRQKRPPGKQRNLQGASANN